VEETTWTLTVQVPPAAMVPFEKESDPAPAAGEKVGDPHPLVAALGVEATTRLPGEIGRVSVNVTPERDVVRFGFEIVKVSVVGAFTLTGFGEKDFEITGGSRAVSVALADQPAP
jgi:hypothetical protein